MHTLLPRLRSDEPTTGYFAMAASPLQLERLAGLGYDYIVLDGQHGTYSEHDLPDAVRAVECGGAPAVVRVPEGGIGTIGRALDMGAAGVIVPLVNDRAQAEAVVAAAKYPPQGVRSRGLARTSAFLTGSLGEVNGKTFALCMIETREGLENVEEIAATPGLDGLYIGPNDLTIGLGGYGLGDPAVADEFAGALQRILAAGRAHGVPVVIHTASGEIAAQRRGEGFTHVAVANELNHLCDAAKGHLEASGHTG
ncbi:HpcH/HpaI aldolase family protein [Brevibacterium album]|uniref:HpcH/HpaI aldolase family protein n=1 Tax=Brevibacterium album TaxID=417948 RepID=UPI00040131B6|nr:aldolase/citrate lyase family protein [Brevibacterium album]